MLEFGETVQFIRFRPEPGADKLDAKLQEGACLGLDRHTDENVIGTSYWVYRGLSIEGGTEDKRWDAANVLAAAGLLWDPTPNIDAEDGARVPNAEAAEAEVMSKDPEVPEAVARRMYNRKADTVKYGETPGCLGCRCIALGKHLQSHTAACRDGIENCFRETDEGRRDWTRPMAESQRRSFGNQNELCGRRVGTTQS